MTFLSAIILLGILIFVHELGHFLFAKLLNVKVLKFSLGFGPRLLGKKFGETEYLLSAVPLGGYVKMLGEEVGDEITDEEKARAFNFQSVWKRMLIVFSGPVFNILSASLIFVFIFLAGVPVSYPDIGKVNENSPAARAGLMTGDRVLEINGKKILSWDEIEAFVDDEPGKSLLFRVQRKEEIVERSVIPERKSERNIFGEKKEVWDIGITPLLFPVVGEVMKGSRAEKAGIKKGDRIIGIAGAVPETWQDMTKVIHENPEKSLRFVIKRNGQIIELAITPERSTVQTIEGEEKAVGLIGIKPLANDFIKRYGPAGALSLGVKKTWDICVLTVVSIIKLIERIIPAETIGGPILIVQMAGEQAAHGLLSFFTFLAIISINLGVLNLLPIPILDGGHILFFTIEAIRRKPLSEKTMMIAQRAGLAIIVSLMIFAFYNDIMRLITGKVIR